MENILGELLKLPLEEIKIKLQLNDKNYNLYSLAAAEKGFYKPLLDLGYKNFLKFSKYIYLYEKAFEETGNCKAVRILIKFYRYKKNFDKMIEYCKKGVENNDIKCIFTLGEYYYFNYDYENSAKYLLIVAELKNIKAIHYLITLKNNYILKDNDFNLEKYLLIGAELNDLECIENICLHYKLNNNLEKMLKYCNIGVENNSIECTLLLASFYSENNDFKKAIEIYKNARYFDNYRCFFEITKLCPNYISFSEFIEIIQYFKEIDFEKYFYELNDYFKTLQLKEEFIDTYVKIINIQEFDTYYKIDSFYQIAEYYLEINEIMNAIIFVEKCIDFDDFDKLYNYLISNIKNSDKNLNIIKIYENKFIEKNSRKPVFDFRIGDIIFIFGYFYQYINFNYDLMNKYYIMASKFRNSQGLVNMIFYHIKIDFNPQKAKEFIVRLHWFNKREKYAVYSTLEFEDIDFSQEIPLDIFEENYISVHNELDNFIFGYYFEHVEKNYALMQLFYESNTYPLDNSLYRSAIYHFQNKNYNLMKKYYYLLIKTDRCKPKQVIKDTENYQENYYGFRISRNSYYPIFYFPEPASKNLALKNLENYEDIYKPKYYKKIIPYFNEDTEDLIRIHEFNEKISNKKILIPPDENKYKYSLEYKNQKIITFNNSAICSEKLRRFNKKIVNKLNNCQSLHIYSNEKYNGFQKKIKFSKLTNNIKNIFFLSEYNFNISPTDFLHLNNLTKIIFDYHFNKPIHNEKISFLPNSVQYLVFGVKFNQTVNFLPKNLKVLIFDDSFDKPVDNLPFNLQKLIFGISFNQPVDHLPPNIKKIVFGEDFNQSVDLLPSSLENLYFGEYFNKNVDNLPNSIIRLKFGRNFNKKITSLPFSLKKIIFGECFNNNEIKNYDDFYYNQYNDDNGLSEDNNRLSDDNNRLSDDESSSSEEDFSQIYFGHELPTNLEYLFMGQNFRLTLKNLPVNLKTIYLPEINTNSHEFPPESSVHYWS